LANESDLKGRIKGHLCFSVPEAATLLGISRGLGYELARSGRLPVIRFGRRLLVPKAALHRMLEKCNHTPIPKSEPVSIRAEHNDTRKE
jgi:excisionase family DNA binding protein